MRVRHYFKNQNLLIFIVKNSAHFAYEVKCVL